MKILNISLKESGAIENHQKLTTHGFRRTGANIIAFYQPNGRWNLSLVRNYCGWTNLSESDMLTRYLIHTCNTLDDEATEAFNPYRVKHNIVVADQQTEKYLDSCIQKSFRSCIEQYFKTAPVEATKTIKAIENKTTVASISIKASKTVKSSKLSLFPSCRISRGKSLSRIIEDAWFNIPYNIKELHDNYRTNKILLVQKDIDRLEEWNKVGKYLEGIGAHEFHRIHTASRWKTILKESRIYVKENGLNFKVGRSTVQ